MKPADDEGLAAETWTTEGVASPDRLPMRVERECNGGVERALADRALLLKKKTKQSNHKTKNKNKKEKQNNATTDKDQGKTDRFH